MSASLIYANVYPVPAVVTVAADIAPAVIVTEATPPDPSPRIGIALIVEPDEVLNPDPPPVLYLTHHLQRQLKLWNLLIHE